MGILEQVKGKTTVVFSTHVLSDVERICDRIAVLNNGKVALSGSIAELKAQHRADELVVEFSSAEECSQFTTLLTPTSQSETIVVFQTHNLTATQTLVMQTLAQNNLLPMKMEVKEPSIENLFMGVIK